MLFLYKTEVIDIHERLIEEFGGINGLRDEGALESALSSVENRAYYENADILICAATYAYHLTQAHAFIDGNKRIAAAISEIFLDINSIRLNATNDQIVDLFLSIASGEKSRNDVEQIFLQWVS
ncbi:MAG: type II toxin-antitoxin system death-on-curing family toxin [Deltaproteobacteria bacterium]|jgi:death-on-curing protein